MILRRKGYRWGASVLLVATGLVLGVYLLRGIFLYPYLKADIDADTISLVEAQELIDCLWMRFNDRGQICREQFYGELAALRRDVITASKEKRETGETQISLRCTWPVFL